jgi:dodecin
MSAVTRVIEVSAASERSIEDAVQGGLAKVASTVEGIKGAWVNEINVRTSPDGRITEWRVHMRVGFLVK